MQTALVSVVSRSGKCFAGASSKAGHSNKPLSLFNLRLGSIVPVKYTSKLFGHVGSQW